jgi:hypothetical protein
MSDLHSLFNTPWQAFVTSLSSIGLLTFIYVVWKIGTFLVHLTLAIASVRERFVAGEGTINLIATNHLPHLQIEMEKTNAQLAQLTKYAEMYVVAKVKD